MHTTFSNIYPTTERVFAAVPNGSEITSELALAELKSVHPGDWEYQKTHFNIYPGSVHYAYRRPVPPLQPSACR